jgi:tetratricopeptide (TPR) repeat protein
MSIDSEDLPQAISHAADLFVAGDIPALSQVCSDLMSIHRLTPERMTLEVYLALFNRGLSDDALRFAITSCAATGGLPAMEAFARNIYENQDKTNAVNLILYLVSQGSKDYFLARIALDFLFSIQSYTLVFDLYEKVKDIVTLDNTEEVVFCNIVAAYGVSGHIDQAVALLKKVRAKHPDSEDAHALLFELAANGKNKDAFDAYFEALGRRIENLPFVGSLHSDSPYRLDFSEYSLEAVLRSINQHGLCYLKGAIHEEWCAEMLDTLNRLTISFPTRVEDIRPNRTTAAYRFDPAVVMSEILGRTARYDAKFSFLRNVRPDSVDSFLPYHQDTTAFGLLIANIWAPLTPAGGDYPSLELVRKRITINEQTKIQGSRHGLIEIEEAYVQAKYGDLLYEVADARPGDCVIFLGTTIHRSANLRDATRPRYNAELRWS